MNQFILGKGNLWWFSIVIRWSIPKRQVSIPGSIVWGTFPCTPRGARKCYNSVHFWLWSPSVKQKGHTILRMIHEEDYSTEDDAFMWYWLDSPLVCSLRGRWKGRIGQYYPIRLELCRPNLNFKEQNLGSQLGDAGGLRGHSAEHRKYQTWTWLHSDQAPGHDGPHLEQFEPNFLISGCNNKRENDIWENQKKA